MTSSPSSTRESRANRSRFFEPGVSTMFSNRVGTPVWRVTYAAVFSRTSRMPLAAV